MVAAAKQWNVVKNFAAQRVATGLLQAGTERKIGDKKKETTNEVQNP